MVEHGRDVDTDRPDAACAAPPEPRPASLAPVRAPTVADRLLEDAEGGVLACDGHGVLRVANAAARSLLPGLRVGALLVGPLAGAGPGVDALAVGDRRLSVRRRALSDGWVAWHVRDVTDEHARLDSLLAERARSRFLAAASRRLGLSLHPGRTARAVVELSAAELAAVAVVVWPQAGTDALVHWMSGTRGAGVHGGTALTAALPAPVRDALRGYETTPRPVLLDDLRDLPGVDALGVAVPGAGGAGADGPPVDDREPGVPAAGHPGAAAPAAGVVALPGNGSPAGALVLLRHDGGPATAATAVDAALVEEFAQRAGIALAAATLYAQQVHTTAVLRGSLVQPPLPEIPGVTLGAVYRPSDEGMLIGGDFYDVLPGAGSSATVLLGDVCGKGVDAAVGTGQLRQSVRALRRLADDPVQLLGLLNATMLEGTRPDRAPRFATLVLGTATRRPHGGVRLELAGGGHLPPLVVRRGGTVESVDIAGMLVGAVPEARFGRRAVDLAPGESCVLYTDGVTEARGGVDGRQVFGEERLADVLAGCDVLPAPGIAERVAQHATRWLAAGSHDDIAVLVVQAPLPVRPRAGRAGPERADGPDRTDEERP